MATSRQYELVYIVSPDATDQEIADLHTQVETIVARFNAELAKTENWGRRKLAYEIGRHKEGTYVLEVVNGGGEVMKEIDRRLKVSDKVIRHLVVRVDEELRVAERSRTRRAAARAAETARRIARGLPPRPEPVPGREGGRDDDRGYEGEG